ncbi:hypothetical protein OP10G_2228 [Fimbriimonas ginsengisoli Gsoil 348]|uniref:Uncharacterized protein n=1 Tax=Fimbriimonas ginsengisoli Gsoil 348 TaxID=661478 RepID=A0A068NQB6_FIMGI|nr:hypothetical protein OP10G_2228 [Fimbriimonas ginsengisoli Gsoil 348]
MQHPFPTLGEVTGISPGFPTPGQNGRPSTDPEGVAEPLQMFQE